MQRPCDTCRRPYEAKTARSRFCSDLCRANNKGRPPAEVMTLPDRSGSVSTATRTELESVDRAESALGQAALALAERIDSRTDTGSALASLTREWRATLEAATAGTKTQASAIDQARDELARRRASRGA